MEDKTAEIPFEIVKKAPNILTLLRICLIPFFVVLLIHPNSESRIWASIIFVIASLTDWLDGYIARAYQAESILGTLLDPIADKVLVMAALVMLASADDAYKIPAWIVVCLLAREFLISGLRSLAAVKGTVVPASRAAKHKTGWTMLAIFFLLIAYDYQVFGYDISFYNLGIYCIWIALMLSVGSGIQYAIALKKFFWE
ncbi:MAG: CDP-diacylglycerol--glycerol-3-phosphate 3-phosphatidyltransferase [Proteobacteria bacterium]|nr:CDP-diacylglycerol--glycerol-3-phosphate 3-phosphatidyltransferase [Pseudomonadota bacterium]